MSNINLQTVILLMTDNLPTLNGFENSSDKKYAKQAEIFYFYFDHFVQWTFFSPE